MTDLFGARSRPLVIAHRGSSAGAPENTMAAFRLALEEGAEMIELDVRLSRDGHPVVHHDRRLGRTTDGRGRLADRTLAELRRLDAGRWFGRAFAGERIPTLEEVLAWLPAGAGLNIEVKTDGDGRPAAAVAAALEPLLRPSGAPILLSSFDHRFLHVAHNLTPRILIGALVLSGAVPGSRPRAIARRTGASALIIHRRALRKGYARKVHEAGMALVCYGIDNRAHVRAVRSRGLDGMITNNPALLRRLLEGGV